MSLEFCDEPGCLETAQTADPTCKDRNKFKCPRHEAEARARGETGKRLPLPEDKAEVWRNSPSPEEWAARRGRGRPPKAKTGTPAENAEASPAGRVVEYLGERATGRSWASAKGAGEALDLHPAAVAGAIKRGELIHGRRYAYGAAGEEKECVMANRRMLQRVRNVTTGEEFDGVNFAGLSVGKSGAAVRMAINGGRAMKDGTRFVWADGPQATAMVRLQGLVATAPVLAKEPSPFDKTAEIAAAAEAIRRSWANAGRVDAERVAASKDPSPTTPSKSTAETPTAPTGATTKRAVLAAEGRADVSLPETPTVASIFAALSSMAVGTRRVKLNKLRITAGAVIVEAESLEIGTAD